MPLLDPRHLPAYRAQQHVLLDDRLAAITEERNGGSADLVNLYESAVASSQIEGSKVTLSIFKATMETAGNEPKPRDVQEVADLVTAYQFAQQHPLKSANLLEAHRIASALLVHANDQGAWRSKGVKVGNAVTTVYMAAHQSLVPKLMEELMAETDALLQRKLYTTEAFYYAALLHLQFVKIHPYNDGNGRAGRLLEKWFLAKHVGPAAWLLNSELYYRNHLQQYYDALRRIGPDWVDLDMDQCIPFLLLLPKGLRQK